MYSNSVAEWDGTATPLNEQRGWRCELWTALVDNTTTEPHPDNTDWQLDTEVNLTGITFQVIPDPIDYLQTKLTAVTFTKEHTNRPPEAYVGGITFEKFRNKPYLIVNIQ